MVRVNHIAIKKRKQKLAVLFLIILFILIFLNVCFRPIIKNIASNKARIIATEVVNEAIIEDMNASPADYSEIISINKNKEDEISVMVSNVEKINRLKSRLSSLIQKKLCNLRDKKMHIALGTLTGFEILNGKGPLVPLDISASGNIMTDIKSHFESCGINQTIHRMSICIQTKITVIMPGCSSSSQIDTNILINETVLAGKVPHFYSSSEPLSTSDVLNSEK